MPDATRIRPTSENVLTTSGHLLEAFKELRRALNQHTEPLQGYTANKLRDIALATAVDHIEQARRLIEEGRPS